MHYVCDICNVNLLPGTLMYCCSQCPGTWSVCAKHCEGLTQVPATAPPASLDVADDDLRQTVAAATAVAPAVVTTAVACSSSGGCCCCCLTCPSGYDSPLTVVPSNTMYQCDICNFLYLTPEDKMYCCKTSPGTWSVCTKHHDGFREQPPPAHVSNSSSTTIYTTTTRTCPWDHPIPIKVVPPNMIYQCDICDVDLLPGTTMYCCSKCPGSWSVCVNHYFN